MQEALKAVEDRTARIDREVAAATASTARTDPNRPSSAMISYGVYKIIHYLGHSAYHIP